MSALCNQWYNLKKKNDLQWLCEEEEKTFQNINNVTIDYKLSSVYSNV